MTTNYKNILKIVSVLGLGILLGWLLFGSSQSNNQEEHVHTHVEGSTTWTCSMHPQIQRNEPGDCPICGMDLIPMDAMENELDPSIFQMSESAMKLANIQTVRVGMSELGRKIRLNGKVKIDERNSYTQATHIPGRVEKLSVNFTGEKVRRGQTLATIYSPELVTAQDELLQAQSMKASQPALFEAAVEKLKRWKIGQNQINKILQNGEALESFPIQADRSGIVTEKNVELGDYVERGMALYEISDLSKVWIMFDLYEGELKWVEEATEIEYTVNGLPGQTFSGTISFIDPLLEAQTRVASARVEVANSAGELKPGMFVSGVVQAQQDTDQETIVIPKSAVLWTGERSVVYVKDNEGFKMREVVLGAALGESYAIQDGLNAGEEIVINGTFTLDAAVQLSGRPSMMNPNVETAQYSDEVKAFQVHQAQKDELSPVFEAYFAMKNALAADQFNEARRAGELIRNRISGMQAGFKGDAQAYWSKQSSQVVKVLTNIEQFENIESLRNTFLAVSNNMIQVAQKFKPFSETVYIQHCPMADTSKGADWLSQDDEIINPYFGESMLSCGEVSDVIN